MTPKQRKNNGYSLVNRYTRTEPNFSLMSPSDLQNMLKDYDLDLQETKFEYFPLLCSSAVGLPISVSTKVVEVHLELRNSDEPPPRPTKKVSFSSRQCYQGKS